jgi:hypothetical protein
VSLPGIPSFTSHEKHRHWILEHMAGAFRVMARKGFCEGMSGHIRSVNTLVTIECVLF